MATDLSIDPELLEHTLDVGGERTKKATVSGRLRNSSHGARNGVCSN